MRDRETSKTGPIPSSAPVTEKGSLSERLSAGDFVFGRDAASEVLAYYEDLGRADGVTLPEAELFPGISREPALDLSGSYSIALLERGEGRLAKPFAGEEIFRKLAREVPAEELLRVLLDLHDKGRVPHWVRDALEPELRAGRSVADILEQLPERGTGILVRLFASGTTGDYLRVEASSCISRDDLKALLSYVPLAKDSPVVELVAEKIFRSRGIPVASDAAKLANEVAVTSGSSLRAFTGALRAFSPNRNATIFIPQGTFEPLVEYADRYGEVCLVPTADSGFTLTPERLSEAVGQYARSRAPKILVLVDPVANIGTQFRGEQLRGIGKVLLKHDMRAIVDELYAHVPSQGGEAGQSLASLSFPGRWGRTTSLYSRVVTISGNSKILPDNRYRYGFACCGDPKVIASIREFASADGAQPDLTDGAIIERGLKELQGRRGFTQLDRQRFADGLAALTEGIASVNAQIGTQFVSLLHRVETGFYACIALQADKLARIGITSSQDLSDYFALALGLGARAIDGMGLGLVNGRIGLRLNFAEVSAGEVKQFMARIGEFGKAIMESRAPSLNKILDQIVQDGNNGGARES